MNKQQLLLHLSLINGVGPVAIITILKALMQQQGVKPPAADVEMIGAAAASLHVKTLYRFTAADFRAMGLSVKIAQLVVDGLLDKALLDAELKLIDQHRVRLCTWFDDDYPAALKHITVPPPVLYCKGGLFEQRRMIAIVGARQANEYAQVVINQMVPVLTDHGWTIVSGGAVGADTMAHKAAQKDGRTIVVLGSGLLSLYPPSNRLLFDRIVEQGGMVISPFSLKTTPERWNFPIRNRIIAGLSEGCIVVQAAEKSGALITAQYALESGREVFAVPGQITDPLSAGCHALLRQGATLVHAVDDILSSFDMVERREPRVSVQPAAVVPTQMSIVEDCDDPLYAALREPATVDDLCDKVDWDVVRVQNRLFELQLDGKIEQDLSGFWRRL